MGVRTREKPKDSGIWWVFINHQGKRVSRKVGTKAAAQNVAEQIQARLTLGQDALPTAKPKLPTLAEYYERIKKTYIKTATRHRTQEIYKINFTLHINPVLGSKSLDEISRADIRDFIARLVEEKNLARATIRIIMSQLTAVLNHAIEDGLILSNPAARCGKFFKQARVGLEEIQPLSADEVKAFLGTVLQNSPRYFALFLAAIHTGMRLSELAGLQWGDLDFRGKFLTVRRQVVYGRIQPTKTDKIRRIDMSDSLMEAFRRHRKAKREEWLKEGVDQIPFWAFANKEGHSPDMQNVKNRHFYPNLNRAGLRRIRFHDLRHTFASLLIQDGQPLAYVKDQLGHSSIKLTVDVYAHLQPGANREAVNRLPTIKDAPAEPMKKASSG